MATFTFDSLANGAVVTFNVATDTLIFLDASTAASAITLSQSADGDEVIVTVAGKSVTLTPVFGVDTLSPANFSIAGGGQVLIGDLLNTDVQDGQGNNITGSNESDYIAGLGQNDSLSGGNGDDRFHLLPGAFNEYGLDTIDGGNGFDVVVFDRSSPLAANVDLGNPGPQTGGYLNSSVTLASIEGVVGTGLNDTLVGDGVANLLDGANGNDTLGGGNGNDTLVGGAGNDTLDGGNGTDVASYAASTTAINASLGGAQVGDGNGGTDTLISVEGLVGSAFNDTLAGAGTADRLVGGAGNDSLLGADGDDTLTAAGGNDRLSGGNGSDSILGGAGADTLEGGEGDDRLQGSAENDSLVGANGADTLTAAGGDDTLTGAGGDDSLVGGAGNDSLAGGAGNDVLDGVNDRDRLEGKAGDDTLLGGNGEDTLTAAGGNDLLAGGAGSDSLRGGAGDDVFSLGATALGTGDVIAGDADIAAVDAGDVLDITAQLAALLTVSDGAALGGIDASSNIWFDSDTDLLMIDLNDDGGFAAGSDFSIELVGVATVTFNAADSTFSFTLDP